MWIVVVKVFWTEAALAQLQTIYDFISHTSPEYASRMIDRLTKRSIQIAEFPYSGRVVPEYELNEVREVLESPYRTYIQSIRSNYKLKY